MRSADGANAYEPFRPFYGASLRQRKNVFSHRPFVRAPFLRQLHERILHGAKQQRDTVDQVRKSSASDLSKQPNVR